MLEIKNLHVSVEGEKILKGFSLTVNAGEIHAIMGPNGAGKSTLAKVLAGHPDYEITDGSITFLGKNLLELEIDERAHLGLFMGFQYPVEIPGVTNLQFLHSALNSKRKSQGEAPLSEEVFRELLMSKMQEMEISPTFSERDINGGFSGGEKKRNEILQMAVLQPKLAVLDETDSGLDIDAMKVVAAGVKSQLNDENALILITHYQRLLDYIKPQFVHVVVDGKVAKTGGAELALKLEEKGYAIHQ
ncbi:Fe-S cluster assembly ATPase SufC [Candidatus Neptunichlamydia sp. REUL1]|uniref:Fe-S cluster assembly ATPase SufC n=1 Tax=Candidatus Neptunichlamydia sp. REUL1 TaxID=3064277 RepID=UPI002930F934|nr:Fe-S cluster assembly ATPase SufC [Candidatus Neptunochlamydia sp. REUL1]